MQILIYQDYVHNNGALHRALCDHFGAGAVGFCDARDIVAGCLDKDVALFVMPGGADLFYAEKLNGAGNAALRRWVEAGGAYLGICAGAYYACAALSWAAGTPQEIAGPRELALFPGIAAGPVAAFVEEGDAGKSWHAAARIVADDGAETFAHYNGGPLFEGRADTVLARYADLPGKPAAAIACAVGKGRAVLCSFHPESTPETLAGALYRHRNPSYAHHSRAVETLQAHGVGMEALRARIFDHALSFRKEKAA